MCNHIAECAHCIVLDPPRQLVTGHWAGIYSKDTDTLSFELNVPNRRLPASDQRTQACDNAEFQCGFSATLGGCAGLSEMVGSAHSYRKGTGPGRNAQSALLRKQHAVSKSPGKRLCMKLHAAVVAPNHPEKHSPLYHGANHSILISVKVRTQQSEDLARGSSSDDSQTTTDAPKPTFMSTASRLQEAAELAVREAATDAQVDVAGSSSVCFPGCIHMVMSLLRASSPAGSINMQQLQTQIADVCRQQLAPGEDVISISVCEQLPGMADSAFVWRSGKAMLISSRIGSCKHDCPEASFRQNIIIIIGTEYCQ